MLAILELTDFALISLIVVLFTAATAITLHRPAEQARLRRVERMLELILKELNIAPPPDPTTAEGLSDEVRRLADDGRKIEAIKVHREQTGVGLKEAKDAIETYLTSRPE